MTILSLVWSDKGESTTFRSLNFGVDNRCLVMFIEPLVRFATDLLRIFIILLIESILLRRQQRESRFNILSSVSIAFFYFIFKLFLANQVNARSSVKRKKKKKSALFFMSFLLHERRKKNQIKTTS